MTYTQTKSYFLTQTTKTEAEKTLMKIYKLPYNCQVLKKLALPEQVNVLKNWKSNRFKYLHTGSIAKSILAFQQPWPQLKEFFLKLEK